MVRYKKENKNKKKRKKKKKRKRRKKKRKKKKKGKRRRKLRTRERGVRLACLTLRTKRKKKKGSYYQVFTFALEEGEKEGKGPASLEATSGRKEVYVFQNGGRGKESVSMFRALDIQEERKGRFRNLTKKETSREGLGSRKKRTRKKNSTKKKKGLLSECREKKKP